MRKFWLPWQCIFLPLKVYCKLISKSLGFLALGVHCKVPADCMTEQSEHMEQSQCCGNGALQENSYRRASQAKNRQKNKLWGDLTYLIGLEAIVWRCAYAQEHIPWEGPVSENDATLMQRQFKTIIVQKQCTKSRLNEILPVRISPLLMVSISVR